MQRFTQSGHILGAAFIELAYHSGSCCNRIVVQLGGQLVFDDGALLLDNQYFFKALGELMRAFRFERPWHANFKYAQANGGG